MITLFFESNMLTSQGILRNHYSLVFPAQLISDRTKYKRKPSGKFKENKRKRSHDSQSRPKEGPKQRKGNDKERIQTKCPIPPPGKGPFAKPVIRQQ